MASESRFFSTPFDEGGDAERRISWAVRGRDIGAQPFDRAEGMQRFVGLWAHEHHSNLLKTADIEGLARHLEYVQVPADRELIAQDELGDYFLVVLDGRIAVDRMPAWGGRTRLAEARAGEILGEMSLLDAGARFSTCRTLTPCTLGVMDAARLDAMIESDARLGVALLASLSRRLSLRLRKVSARLSALLSQN